MKPFRWGVLGTGTVAKKFILGLRGSTAGSVVAVASRTESRAIGFAKGLALEKSHASYQALLSDPSLDAVYIATSPDSHCNLAINSLKCGKPTLLEKPFAMTSGEAAQIISTAREHQVFCMEAMWTRFIPAVVRLKELLAQNLIGDIRMITGSFGIPELASPDHPLFRADMGGGALLDRGVYLISLVVAMFGEPTTVVGKMFTGAHGVDEDTTMLLTFESGSTAVLRASLTSACTNDLVISGTAGQIRLHTPIYRPSHLTLTHEKGRPFRRSNETTGLMSKVRESGLLHTLRQRLSETPLGKSGRGKRSFIPYLGNGYHYEAAEVRHCVKDGRLESDIMPLSESMTVMKIVEQVRASAE